MRSEYRDIQVETQIWEGLGDILDYLEPQQTSFHQQYPNASGKIGKPQETAHATVAFDQLMIYSYPQLWYKSYPAETWHLPA